MIKQIVAGVSVVVLGITGTALATPNKNPQEDKKVYVCKYVGTPGVNERLQTGQNPIHVSVNSIKLTPPDTEVSVGDEFADAQGRSVVVADGASCAPATPDKDICPNLEGNQATVPEGFRLEGKNCLENDGEPAGDPDPVKDVESTTSTSVVEQETEVVVGK